MLENNTPEIVFDLAQKGKFDSLSHEQQNMVSQYLSRQEFDNMHLLSRGMSNVFAKDVASLKPNPQIRQDLLSKFPSKQWNFDFFKNMFSYKVPVYRLALGAAAAYVALFIITPIFKDTQGIEMAGTSNQPTPVQIQEGAPTSIDDLVYEGGSGANAIDEFDIFTGASLADDAVLKKVLEVRD